VNFELGASFPMVRSENRGCDAQLKRSSGNTINWYSSLQTEKSILDEAADRIRLEHCLMFNKIIELIVGLILTLPGVVLDFRTQPIEIVTLH